MPAKLVQILEILEKAYGPQQLAGPTDAYEMIVFLNCGYPASDGACAKGFDALKILLFSGLAPVAAVPSAFVDVPIRLFVGEPGKNYAANYRTARGVLDMGLPRTFEARKRAYLLLKKHGQEICKRSKPKCESCPLAAHCAYLQAKAADSNIE